MSETLEYNKATEVKDGLLDISEKIMNLKFKHRIIGGVDKLDVWYKLSQIDKEYQSIIEAQKKIYEAKISDLEAKLANYQK